METVGGYNLVRELGSGDRARVFLGRSATPSLAADALHGTVAVKVFRPDIDLSTIDDEIAALIRTQSKHVVQLLDLSTHLDGAPILILQRLVPGGLSQLLMTRQFVAAGEAVTILAPLAEAIGLAHRVGVAHGAMRVSAVLFDDHWAPVLACFGRARAIVFSRTGPPTPAMIEQSDDMLQDLHGLCAIVLAVLARVGDPAAHSSIQAIKDWLDMSGRQGFPSSFCAELGSRLFDLSDPAPIGVDSALPSPGTRHPSTRLIARVPLGSNSAPTPQHDGLALVRPSDGKFRRSLLLLLQGIRVGRSQAGRLRLQATKRLSRVRRSVWRAAVVGSVISCGLVMLLPMPAAERTTPRAPLVAADEWRNHADDSGGNTPASAEIVAGEHPLAAAEALLALRGRCLQDLSIDCLTAVNQRDSVAWKADRDHVLALRAGEAGIVDNYAEPIRLTVLDRMGDFALLAVDYVVVADVDEKKPASVLIIRTEAGWRIRNTFLD